MPDTSTDKPQPQGLYKLTIHARRHPSLSEAAFHHHWTHVHAPKVGAWLRRHGIVGYTQYHTPSWTREAGAETLQTLGGFATRNAADFDGYVELRMRELGCYERARRDPYYAEVVQPDEEAFFDFEASMITVGWEETYVDASQAGELAEAVAGEEARAT